MKTPAQICAQFAPIKAVLDSALAHGGGQYQADSPGAAVHFRQRAYAFRKAYREAIAPAASPYEALTLRRLAPGETVVKIEPQHLSGTFIPADGDPIRQPEPAVDDDDPLMQEATRIRQELDL